MSRAVVWFRSDLRLDDNPAWAAATSGHERVTPLFVVDRPLWEAAGRLRRAQLAAHLRSLDERLQRRGGRLRVEHGSPGDVVPTVARGADVVYWNADVTPYAVRRDERVAADVDASIHQGRYVHPPGSVTTSAGSTYLVFTPFFRAWSDRSREPWPTAGDADVTSTVGGGVPDEGPAPMEPGEEAALGRLHVFLGRVDDYHEVRDRPDLDATSRLSADLKFGVLSPRQVVDAVRSASDGPAEFVRQVAWREFHAHLMAAMPRLVAEPMRPEYAALAWRDDPVGLAAWQEGRTGYPLVDAGMRQLREEGWMHNRVRMITASFLVKDLLIDWRLGERHFRRLLTDADLPQNVGNWQWVAGTGADAAPYFRVFNPVTQSRRFDPDGVYIRRWVPELGGLESPGVHAPWEAASLDLAMAGVVLGDTYPNPIVDHAEARVAAIAAYEEARASSR